MSQFRDAILLQEFVRYLKDNGHVIATESNDPEYIQELSECMYVGDLITEFTESPEDKFTEILVNDEQYQALCKLEQHMSFINARVKDRDAVRQARFDRQIQLRNEFFKEDV